MTLARRIAVLVALSLLAGACGATGSGAPPPTTAGDTTTTTRPPPSTALPSDPVEAIRARGRMLCGVVDGMPGFAEGTASGQAAGFDVDLCRAVATAVLGGREAVRFVVLEGLAASALESNGVDVVSARLGEDDLPGGSAGPVVFHDGLQVLARGVDGFDGSSSLGDLTGVVCVAEGWEEALAGAAPEVEARPVDSVADGVGVFKAGGCRAVAGQGSELMTAKVAELEGAGWALFPSPAGALAPGRLGLRAGEAFARLLDAVVAAMLEAEAAGLTSSTVASRVEEEPAIARLLAVPDDLARELDLAPNALVEVIRQVGTYGEVFERNLGVHGIPRGANGLVRDGGLMGPTG